MSTRQKKIMFFLHTLSGGGAERTIINIMNNVDEDRFEVLLVLGTNKNNDYMHLVPEHARVKILNISRLRFSLLKLRKCIKEERPDLLFSTINGNNIALLLANMLTFSTIPTIVREANHRTQSGSISRINRITTFFTYNYLAKNVVALSNGVKEDLVDNFKVKEEKITVIYNPVEIDEIKTLSEKKTDDLIIKDDEKAVIAVGRLVEQKDYPTLLKAFEIVTKSINARLLILGKGPLEEELKELSKELDIEKRVDFLGFKKNPYKYMERADVFVLSSKWEGFGHVIVEAMATGTPVISTDCKSGPGEIIEDNTYGILTPVGDYETLAKRICDILINDEMSSCFSARGLKRSEDFNAKNIVKEYEKLFYDSLT